VTLAMRNGLHVSTMVATILVYLPRNKRSAAT
jgi:hypothetical protein